MFTLKDCSGSSSIMKGMVFFGARLPSSSVLLSVRRKTPFEPIASAGQLPFHLSVPHY
jgi:hypothetical protein